MTYGMRWLLAAMVVLAFGAARAEEYATFDGCVDGSGRPVLSILDTTLAQVVASGVAEGRPAIRYNPNVLPGLQPTTRLFLFAHECARHELRLVGGRERTLADARRADCSGLATLLRSRLIATRDVPAIEFDPALAPESWNVLPGPARRLDLGGCLEELAARSSLAIPTSAGRTDWNACVRACGEPLRVCRRECTGAACGTCQSRYEQCSSLCDFRHPL